MPKEPAHTALPGTYQVAFQSNFSLRLLYDERYEDCIMHQHDFYELTLVVAGSATHLTSTDSYPIGTGDVFLIKPGTAHGYCDIDQLELVNILYRPERLRLPIGDLADSVGYRVLFELEPAARFNEGAMSHLQLDGEALAEARRQAERIRCALYEETMPGHLFKAELFFLELVTMLSDYFSMVQLVSEEHSSIFRLGKMISFLESSYMKNIEIPKMEKMFGISHSKLYRLFVRGTGMSPKGYLQKIRLGHARNLLLNSDLAVSDVARTCGFADSNYFARTFRLHFGTSPRNFRRGKH